VRGLKIAQPARRDLNRILNESERRYGDERADRYRALIYRAALDVRNDPERFGVVRYSAPRFPAFLYHLRHSKGALPKAVRVARPRHLLFFRVQPERLVILRILHEVMQIEIHLGDH
jgi:plasmid stabilization system protein ParE